MAIAKKTVAKKVTTPAKKVVSRKKTPDVPRPEIHAKQISLIVSIGTEDRDRSWEDFEKDVIEAIQKHATVKRAVSVGGYYILDGQVCLPPDYDPKTQNFKPGATPPAWAGGPKPSNVVEKPVQSTYEPKRLSREEADRRIAAGRARTDAERSAKMGDSDDEYEDTTSWDESMAGDHDALGNVADESVKKALKNIPKKRTVKKTAAPVTGTKTVTARRKTTVTTFGEGKSASQKPVAKKVVAKKTAAAPSRRRRTV